jgi:hypothetical protein
MKIDRAHSGTHMLQQQRAELDQPMVQPPQVADAGPENVAAPQLHNALPQVLARDGFVGPKAPAAVRAEALPASERSFFQSAFKTAPGRTQTPAERSIFEAGKAGGTGVPPGQWKKTTPYVNQLNPKGAAQADYKNGLYNCGPAVAAMVARGLGTMDHLSDAELIKQLGSGLTTEKGTSVQNMGKMLEFAGAKVGEGTVLGEYKGDMLRENLAKGNKVIAQVGVRNRDNNDVSSHYVLVDKTDGRGNFLVKDPLKGSYWVSERTLKNAVERAPNGGGALIPVEAPGAQPAADAPTKPAVPPEAPADTFVGPVAPRAAPRSLQPQPAVLPEPGAGAVSDAALARAALRGLQPQPAVLPEPGADAAGGGRAAPRAMPTAVPPVVNPDVDNFETDDAAVEGQDAEFHETEPVQRDEQMVRNDEAVDNDLVRSVIKGEQAEQKQEAKPAEQTGERIIPEGTSQKEFVRDVVKQSLSKSKEERENAEDIIDRLVASPHKEDRQAADQITRALLSAKHGIGQRRHLEDFGG